MYGKGPRLFQSEKMKDIRLEFGVLDGFFGSRLAVNKDIWIWALGWEGKKSFLLFKCKRLFVSRWK